MDDMELDLVTLVDDNGNEITAEVLDYFFYEGVEYAIMTEYKEEQCEGCEAAACENCEQQDQDAFIMKVQPVGEDEEEFIPIDDDLAETLIDYVNNNFYVDDDDDEEYGEYPEESN